MCAQESKLSNFQQCTALATAAPALLCIIKLQEECNEGMLELKPNAYNALEDCHELLPFLREEYQSVLLLSDEELGWMMRTVPAAGNKATKFIWQRHSYKQTCLGHGPKAHEQLDEAHNKDIVDKLMKC